MKNIKILLLAIFAGTMIVSCDDDDDKFTGSPVGVMPIEIVNATVSTDATFALPGQEIDFTVTLPESFRAVVTDTVTVQATIFSMGGAIRNASVDILPGENTGTEKITVAGGGGTFDLNFDLKLTAINLKRVVPGKHYGITSNVINIASGNTGVPSTNDKRLKISVDWENLTAINKLRVKVERVGLTTLTFRGSSGAANVKIGATTYLIPFSTDLNTTAANFVTTHSATIAAAHSIDVTAVGSDLQFRYTSAIPPVITIATVPPNTSTALKGDIYAEVVVGSANDLPKTYFFSASKLGTTSEGVATATQPSAYAYTPGDYRVKIGVQQASDLVVSPTDLKYRIVVRFPDGTVKVYNGVYNGLSVAAGFKSVLLITKNGVGDTTTYGDPVFTP